MLTRTPGRGLDRQVEQVAGLYSARHCKDPARSGLSEPPVNSAWHRKEVPAGLEVTTIAVRPELLEAAYPL
jgi:hypothetical protein